MENSRRWRVVVIGMGLGLIGIGYGLGKSRAFPPSLSSTAHAQEVTPAEPASKEPVLNFTRVNVRRDLELVCKRAKVPGGWFVIVRDAAGPDGLGAVIFYPDPKHEWDGGSLPEKSERTAPHEAVERMPRRLLAPTFKPAEAAAKAMELYDANKDGKISRAELDIAPGLKAALKVIGTDREKGITADQISMRVQRWIDSKIGRTSLSCMVVHNGQPLAGATVKFVPEKSLSDCLETATGTTNASGMAMLTVPLTPDGDLPPGLPPGIYRVEITKPGENIPAKYNTETTLGQEVSLDNLDLQMGIKFNLKY